MMIHLSPRATALTALLVVMGCSPAREQKEPVAPLAYPAATTIAPASPSVPPPRYALPACPLRYEVKDVDESRMDEMPATAKGVAVDTFMTLEARPATGFVELTTRLTTQPRMGKRRSYDVPVESYAPVRLETDGARWTERDGPTQVFNALGSVDGLVLFFPDLPSSGAPGALAEWTITRPDVADVITVEAARGSMPGMKEADARGRGTSMAPKRKPLRIEVRLTRWTEIAGMKVAELSAVGAEDSDEKADFGQMGSMHTIAKAKMLGTYAVTSSGRVLRARVEKDVAITLTTNMNGQESVQHHTQHSVHQMSLVGACDGPTEATLATPLDREERAVRAWGDAWLASTQGNREKTLAVFDPALRKKVGDAKLWDALTSYQKLRGPHAVPPPMLLDDADITSDASGVRIVTHGLTLEAAKNTNHQVSFVLTMHEANAVWLVDSIRADVHLDGHDQNLLEISRDRIVVRKGWPPI